MDFWSTIDPLIVVDYRERASGLLNYLRDNDLFTVEERQLECGDIIVADLGIERKTAHDFVASLEDGRLFKQLLLLKRIFPRRLLIIEEAAHASAPISRKYHGALCRICGSLQIPVLKTGSVVETSTYIQRLALQLFGFTQSRQILRGVPRNRDIAYQQLFVLVGIHGLGVIRARELLKHFGTLRAIFSAPLEELQEVAGIGRVVAERIIAIGTTETGLVGSP